jgi:lauroyl/myristoyl acyltransferase
VPHLILSRVLRSLSQIELGFYRLIIVPLIAFFPASLAYGAARLRGDLCYFMWERPTREIVLRNLGLILGNELSEEQRKQITRDFFRLRSCEPIDIVRLAGKGNALTKLVEIRGLENVHAALRTGKGALLCGAHFGSYHCSFSVLGALGLPITGVGRWPSKADKNPISSIQRIIFRMILQKPVERHRKAPNIQPLPGQIGVAFEIANVLRRNELIGTLLDPPAVPQDRPRALKMNFLNGTMPLLPGAITVSKLTGSPILMTFMRRSRDWQHQVLEISPPMQMTGDTANDFANCLRVVENSIRENPAHWTYWPSLGSETLKGLTLYDNLLQSGIVERNYS